MACFFFDDINWGDSPRFLDNIFHIFRLTPREIVQFLSCLFFSRNSTYTHIIVDFLINNFNLIYNENWDDNTKANLSFIFLNHQVFSNPEYRKILERIDIHPRSTTTPNYRSRITPELIHKLILSVRESHPYTFLDEKFDILLEIVYHKNDLATILRELSVKIDQTNFAHLLFLIFQKIKSMMIPNPNSPTPSYSHETITLILALFDLFKSVSVKFDSRVIARSLDSIRLDAYTEGDILLLLGCYSRVFSTLFPISILLMNTWENYSFQLILIFFSATSPHSFDFNPKGLRVLIDQNTHMENYSQLRVWDFIDYYRRLRDFKKLLPNSDILNRLIYDDSVLALLLRIFNWSHFNESDFEVISFIYSLFKDGTFRGKSLPIEFFFKIYSYSNRRNNIQEIIFLEQAIPNNDLIGLIKAIDNNNYSIEEFFPLFFVRFLKDPNEQKAALFAKELTARNHFASFLSYINKNKNTSPDAANLIRLFERTAVPTQEVEEVESAANLYFQKLYNGSLGMNEFIGILTDLKNSTDKIKQEIFRCMIHNLFDEYKYFAKYPINELQITSVLFGLLIQNQLISSITLGISLRYVLESLRKDPSLGEANEKMFNFGKLAVEQFKSRLNEWPQYCSHLIQIPHLSKAANEIFLEAQRALSNPHTPNPNFPPQINSIPMNTFDPMNSAVQAMPSLGGTAPSNAYLPGTGRQPNDFSMIHSPLTPNLPAHSNQLPAGNLSNTALNQQFMNLNIDNKLQPPRNPQKIGDNVMLSGDASLHNPLLYPGTSKILPNASLVAPALKEQPKKIQEIDRMVSINLPLSNIVTPADGVRDQILFIINNIVKSNLESKVNELKELLKPEYYSWFASYLIEKRVSSQSNFHGVYLSILEGCDSPELYKLILDSTYYNITKYLASPNIITSSNDRTVLRYFGAWLGQLTLARNKPLLHRRINLKNLLIWGYENGRLIAVCTFVAKVIEGVKDSKVFKLPNPWLMAILSVLRELSELEDLKMNIKFEVQVLCKNINVNMNDIPRANILAKCVPPKKDMNNPDFNVKNSPHITQPVAQIQASPTTLPLSNQNIPMPPLISLVDAPSTAPESVPSIPTVSPQLVPQLITDNHSQNNPESNIINYLKNLPINANIRQLIFAAFERGIKEFFESYKSKITFRALETSNQLVFKDFYKQFFPDDQILDPNQVFNFTSNSSTYFGSLLAEIVCKEPLRISISNSIRSALSGSTNDANYIDQLVQSITNDSINNNNIFSSTLNEVIKHVKDSLISTDKSELMNNWNTKYEPVITETFNRLNPEVKSIIKSINSSNFNTASNFYHSLSPFTMHQSLELLNSSLISIENFVTNFVQAAVKEGKEPSYSNIIEHSDVTKQLNQILLVSQTTKNSVRFETMMTFSERVFNRLLEVLKNCVSSSNSTVDSLKLELYINILETLKISCSSHTNPFNSTKPFKPDYFTWVDKHQTLAITSDNDEQYLKGITMLFLIMIKRKLFTIADLNSFLASHIEATQSQFWLDFSFIFIRKCLLDQVGSTNDFLITIEALSKVKVPPNTRKVINKFIAEINSMAPPIPVPSTEPKMMLKSNFSMSNTREQNIKQLLDNWFKITPNINDHLFGQFLQQMNQIGVLKTEDEADKFFFTSVQICVEYYWPIPGPDSTNDFKSITYLARLFLLFVRLADKETNDITVRVNLLSRIIKSICFNIVEAHDAKKNGTKSDFDQRPYYLLLYLLNMDMGMPPQILTELSMPQFSVLKTYAQAYSMLSPIRYPGFAFSWLSLISSRFFMPYLLKDRAKGWSIMYSYLVDLFNFLHPYLVVKTANLPDSVKKLYKGALKIMLVILHDFPDFLSEYSLSFCDIIPIHCIQLKNLILSAFPRAMRLPDPFAGDLKSILTNEAAVSPTFIYEFTPLLHEIRKPLEEFLEVNLASNNQNNFQNNTLKHNEYIDKFLKFIYSNSLIKKPNNMFNSNFLTSVIIFIAQYTCNQLNPNKLNLSTSNAFLLFKKIIEFQDYEFRYYFISILINQLRYPNSHTTFFSKIILQLFYEFSSAPNSATSKENQFIMEQITRVLLERLIAHRPHPWGLLVTFIELIKNPSYHFWNKKFTSYNEEISKVFENMAEKCIGPNFLNIIKHQRGLN